MKRAAVIVLSMSAVLVYMKAIYEITHFKTVTVCGKSY